MDTDWCLRCGRRVEGNTPYCSRECFLTEQPSPSYSDHYRSYPGSVHHNQVIAFQPTPATPRPHWQGNGPDGIRAWARHVPSGPPTASSSSDSISSDSMSSSTPSTHFTPRTPKLLLPHQRPTPPTLCMSTPQPARPHPSLPITTPQQQIASLSISHSKSYEAGSTSTVLSESLLATPSSTIGHAMATGRDHVHKLSVFGTLRSWCTPSHFQSKCAPPGKHLASSTALKGSEPTTFTVLAKTHPSGRGLSSPHDGPEETSSDGLSGGMWWPPSSNAVDSKSRLRSPDRQKFPDDYGVRSHRLTLTHLGARDDHPAYRTRGRKASRAIA